MNEQIPKPSSQQKKAVEMAFLKHFGIAPSKMRKEDLAFMVMNQSSNVQKISWEAQQITMIGLAMKRQRDHYHKIIRFKNHKCNIDGKEYVKL